MCVANSKKRAPPIEWPAYTTLLPMTTVLDRLTGNTVQHPSALRASRAGRTRPAGGSSASPLSAGRAGARAVCAHRHKRKVRADSGLDVRAHTALCGKQSVLQDNTERLLQHYRGCRCTKTAALAKRQAYPKAPSQNSSRNGVASTASSGLAHLFWMDICSPSQGWQALFSPER